MSDGENKQVCDMSRILVADDEAQIRKLFATILNVGMPEVKVDVACNGLEALKSFRQFHQGIVLMDLKMPEMDGLQAFNAIRDFCNEQNLDMPSVVFCTGFIPPETVTQLAGDGQKHGVLHKPVKSEHILSAVRVRQGAAPQSAPIA